MLVFAVAPLPASAQSGVQAPFTTIAYSVSGKDQPAPQSKKFEQLAATCYAANSLGQTFYWVHPNPSYAAAQVLAVCQNNTPLGAFCWTTGCSP